MKEQQAAALKLAQQQVAQLAVVSQQQTAEIARLNGLLVSERTANKKLRDELATFKKQAKQARNKAERDAEKRQEQEAKDKLNAQVKAANAQIMSKLNF